MSDNQQKGNFWTTLPGILTGIAAVITAIAGTSELIKVLNQPKPGNSATAQEVTVHAESMKGEFFRNKDDKYVQVSFKANPSDKWLAIPEHIQDEEARIPESAKGYISAKGDPNFESNSTPCRAPLGALIIMGEDGKCIAYGEEGSFELEPRKTVFFLMNDVPGLYQDNKGSIKVSLSISKN
ncbi:MAG: hypothetical protein MET45_10990 [Nostoc sp. LLA-1]|nr:hypothetical protein [Cyanocohniella sp. LLY]